MNTYLIFKGTVILVLVLILVSLSSGLVFLVKDKGKTNRTLSSLAMRIGLSITLFVLLFVGYKMGWIQPHGITPK